MLYTAVLLYDKPSIFYKVCCIVLISELKAIKLNEYRNPFSFFRSEPNSYVQNLKTKRKNSIKKVFFSAKFIHIFHWFHLLKKNHQLSETNSFFAFNIVFCITLRLNSSTRWLTGHRKKTEKDFHKN